METTRYLRALARSWWLVLITVIAGGAGGYLVFHQTTPMYVSAVRLIVGASGSNPVTNGLANEAVSGQLAALAQTNPAAAAAFSRAGRPPGGFNVNAVASGSFVTISVTSTNRGTAARVANGYLATIKQSADTLNGGAGQYKLTTDFGATPAAEASNLDRGKDVGIGAAAGLVLGLALAILREALNRTVRASDALAGLTGLTVYGTVPLASKKSRLPARNEPTSARAEAYRQIRTSILTRTVKRPLVIAVTSATAGEGKTSVTTNLAAVLSRAGHRVAIIDADLRRPGVHAFFDLDPQVGLSDVLLGFAELEDALIEVDGSTLGIVPSGRLPDDPSELLGSAAMVALLHKVAESYEFVIVDTPPVLSVTDALIVGPMTDGILFVSKLGGPAADRIIKALQAVERVNAETLGVVANQATLASDRVDDSAYKRRDVQGDEPHVNLVPAASLLARPPGASRLEPVEFSTIQSPPRHLERDADATSDTAESGPDAVSPSNPAHVEDI